MDVMDDVLQPETPQDKKSELEVLKELFNIKDVETKTELSIKQIILINQKRTICDLLGWDSLEMCLDDFMLLMISHQRKGRGEFVSGIVAERGRKEEAPQGLFSRLTDKLR